jgi:lipopolysaccharide export system protein LptC
MTVAQHSMDLWGPRRTVSLREARARTNFVHIIRLLFTTAAVVSAGLLVGPVITHSIFQNTPAPTPPGTAVTMINPRFEGKDANGQPYVITADTARRRRENAQLIDLTNPVLEDAASSKVRAREGVYDRENQLLDLVGDVVMTDAAGYTFTSDKARMHIEENRVEGQTPLNGVGPIGDVKGDEYEVRDNGNLIILRGHVQTTILPNRRGE